jgi:hypothetical protein
VVKVKLLKLAKFRAEYFVEGSAPTMARKPLPSQDKIRSLLDCNFETGQLIWRETWTPAGCISGRKGQSKYVRVTIDQHKYFAHRLIWKMAYGDIPDGLMIDHIDRDGTNNRLDNLRLVTNQQNQMNRRADNGKAHKGVYKARDRFKAEITTPSGRLYLGSFDTEKEAAKAYDEAAKSHHGVYAKINGDDDGD